MLGGTMESEKKVLINAFASVYRRYSTSAPSTRSPKDPVLSEASRLEGNRLFKQKNHDSKIHEIIHCSYTRSIALAPASSEELALGYGNRSALLLHLSKYTECIEDIDRALSITRSNVLKTKLLCRKARCLAASGSTEDARIILQKARHFCNNSDEGQRNSLLMLIQQTECLSNNACRIEEVSGPPLKLDKKPDDFSSVSIAHNDKYGNHLVATKDIEAGEVLFIEKPYAFSVDIDKSLTHCDYCFGVSWTTLPCNSCASCMYCSEDCRREALNKYHKIECAAIRNCEISRKPLPGKVAMVVLRALMSGKKEAGGIEKLRCNLEKLDEKRETYLKKSFKEGKLHDDGFKSVYYLHSFNGSKINENSMSVPQAVSLLISLATSTKFFGKKISLEDCKYLMHNENNLFIGALILKIIKTVYSAAKHSDVHDDNIVELMELPLPIMARFNISVLFSLINHSCYPNVSECYTENQKIVVYAVQPIKKNAQLFISYDSSIWSNSNNFLRKFKFLQVHGFLCDCTACENNLPPVLTINPQLLADIGKFIHSSVEFEIFKKFQLTITTAYSNDFSKFNNKMIADLAKGIHLANKNLPHPTFIIYLLVQALVQVFDKLHETNLEVPAKCIQLQP